MSPEELVQQVFLTKPDERWNMKRARIIELINTFNDDIEVNPTRCKFKIAFEDDDSAFEDIMSYNDILDYVEKENTTTKMDIYGSSGRSLAIPQSQERKA